MVYFTLQVTFWKGEQVFLTVGSQQEEGNLTSGGGGGGIPAEDGPGPPGHVVPVLLVHVSSQPVHGGAGQSDGELQELLGKLEGPEAGVQPGERATEQERESPNSPLCQQTVCSFPCTLGEQLFVCHHRPLVCYL